MDDLTEVQPQRVIKPVVETPDEGSFDSYFDAVDAETAELSGKLSRRSQQVVQTVEVEPISNEEFVEERTYEEADYKDPSFEEANYEEPTYEEPTYEEPANEEPEYEDTQEEMTEQPKTFMWGVKPSKEVDPQGKYGQPIVKDEFVMESDQISENVQQEDQVFEYEVTTVTQDSFAEDEMLDQQNMEEVMTNQPIEIYDQQFEQNNDTISATDYQDLLDEFSTGTEGENVNNDEVYNRTQDTEVIPVSPVRIMETTMVTQESTEEPLFDQFDELEDFLTDLAGELGVYENM